MEDKVYEVDSVYPRVAALLRRAYAGEIWLDVLLEKCTSVTPLGIMTQFEQVLKDLEPKRGALEVNGECLGTVADVQSPIKPLSCPFDNTRGCVDGDIWIIEHTRTEDGYMTSECRIRNSKCRAWSDEYGRCTRLQPITDADKARRFRELNKQRESILPRPVSSEEQ